MPIKYSWDLKPYDTLTGIAYPDRAWLMARPILIYADYLFRRIKIQGGLNLVSDVILKGEFSDNVFGEHPNRMLTLALCMPFSVAVQQLVKSGHDVSDLPLANISHTIMCGNMEWLYNDSCEPNGKIVLTIEQIERVSLCFSFIPFIYRTFPDLAQNQFYKNVYQQNIEFHNKLDFSYRLKFKIMEFGWRRMARK